MFVTHHFTAISEGTLHSLLKGRSYNQLMELWDLVIGRKREPLAKQVMSQIIQQKIVWDKIDQNIVDDAIEGSPDMLYLLERAVPKDKLIRITAPAVHAAQAKSSM